MFIHMNIATVPAFSPVGQYADWYWSHMSEKGVLEDIFLHPQPLPEVLLYHEENYGKDFAFDDFIPMLTLEKFDAGEIVQLARDAGMGYVVPVTKLTMASVSGTPR
ncbi:MAG: alpha-L-fucosidase [Dehalococcoidia bacterium]